MTLLQGLSILKNRGVKLLTVVGGSIMIIKDMCDQFTPRDMKLGRLIKRIQSLGKRYEIIEYFHVMRTFNVLVNRKVKKQFTQQFEW